MTNCTACGHELPPDSAFCEECGTPSDATNVHGSGNHPTQPFGATGSPSYPPQGQYGGPSGEGPTTFSGAYAQGGQGDQGVPPAYGGGYAAPQGGYEQGGYEQGGYEQGGYGQGGYDQGAYGQGGYGPGGYDGGEYGAPPGGPGGPGGAGGNGKRKWIIIWTIVALLVVAAIVAVLMLTVFKGDDNKDDDNDPGGDESSSSTDDGGSGIELGAVNEIELDGDEAVLELEAEAGQIIVLTSEQEDLSSPTYDGYDNSMISENWFSGSGIGAWDVAEDGTQEITIEYDGDEDLTSLEVYVDVIDAELLSPGDEVELADGAEIGAAIFEDTNGDYDVPSGLFTDFYCGDGDECTLSGDVLAVATDSGLTIEEIEGSEDPPASTPGAAVLPDGTTSGGTTMPPGGASTTITATESGVITIELIDVAGGGSTGAIDFRLRVLDGGRDELCNRDSSYDNEECVVEVVEGEAYKIEVTEYTGDPAATSDFRLNIVPGGEIF
ncbi:zinc ribbon domain-containing protein [Nocardioides sp. CPCC 205120]|uniref:zinc ribbon domain-containing protein n=1 Tax=Nocardioides sp. CPCC 205120 TaxID=3406462 RepID=UPI003B50F4C7